MDFSQDKLFTNTKTLKDIIDPYGFSDENEKIQFNHLIVSYKNLEKREKVFGRVEKEVQCSHWFVPN